MVRVPALSMASRALVTRFIATWVTNSPCASEVSEGRVSPVNSSETATITAAVTMPTSDQMRTFCSFATVGAKPAVPR